MNKELICDVCKYAKQKRKPFQVSVKRAAKAFDLIHMDLWGQFAVNFVHVIDIL